METVILSSGEREMGARLVKAIGWKHMHSLLRAFPTNPRILVRTYYEDGVTIPEARDSLDKLGASNGLW